MKNGAKRLLARPRPAPRASTQAKRTLIVETAMHLFAEHGYQALRIEIIAERLRISKASIFQHFGTKDALFFEAYKRAVLSLPKYLDAPPAIRQKGFFAIFRYWLEHTEELIHDDWFRFRVAILGHYTTDVPLKREINRFLITQDPYGTNAFVEFGIEKGEVRSDIDPGLIASMVDWMTERYEDIVLSKVLDPGLLRRHESRPERTRDQIDHFVDLLRNGIGRR